MILIWRTADNRRLPIQAMDDAHIHAVLRWISRGKSIGANHRRFAPGEWSAILQAELQRRQRHGSH